MDNLRITEREMELKGTLAKSHQNMIVCPGCHDAGMPPAPDCYKIYISFLNGCAMLSFLKKLVIKTFSTLNFNKENI